MRRSPSRESLAENKLRVAQACATASTPADDAEIQVQSLLFLGRDSVSHPSPTADSVVRRLAARHDAIVSAARQIASEKGVAAVQIAAVAARAGIAAGTVYRSSGKTEPRCSTATAK